MAGYQKVDGKDTDETKYVRRNFDLCMVFRHKVDKNSKFGDDNADDLPLKKSTSPNPSDDPKKSGNEDMDKMLRWKAGRDAILKSMLNCGLAVHCFYSRDRDKVIVKIGAAATKLKDCAARMKYKLEMKPEYLGAYSEFRQDFPGRPENNFQDRRVTSHLYKIHSDDDYPDEDAIFSTVDKILILNHVIVSKDKECAGINVGQFIHDPEHELLQYFPLHEHHHLKGLAIKFNQPSSILKWIIMNPDHATAVREYYGDKVAFYFLFMSFYVKWLVYPAVVGCTLQIIDLLYQTPDNNTAIPWCIYMGCWATFLPHFWRRQVSKYAVTWGTLGNEEQLAPSRPQHWGQMRMNPVTDQVEAFFSFWDRLKEYVKSAMVILAALGITVFVQLCVIWMRHKGKTMYLDEGVLDAMNDHYARGEYANTQLAKGVFLFQVITAAIVEFGNSALGSLAAWRTNCENHRTQTEHDTHRLAKTMLLKMINSYATLYYMAFFKRRSRLFGEPTSCLQDDCFLELQSQLGVFVIFHLVVQNVAEYLWPKIRTFFTDFRWQQLSFVRTINFGLSEFAEMSSAEKQSRMKGYSDFNDFDETLITHGFFILFSVTSPWLASLIMIGAVIEIIVDAKSICENTQRPFPKKTPNNEPWSTAFDIYGFLAGLTNVTLLIFGSDLYDASRFTEKLVLFVFLEHFVFFSRVIISWILPEMPQSVRRMALKNEFMVHRCLENIKVEQAHHVGLGAVASGGFQVEEKDLHDEEDVEITLNTRKDWQGVKDGLRQAANQFTKPEMFQKKKESQE